MHKSCREILNLNNVKLGREFYYQSLPFCVIDAVFSIGVRYESVINVVHHVAQELEKTRFRELGSTYPPQTEQWSISELLELYTTHSSQWMAAAVYNNRCLTSSRSGILKAEAVKRFCEVLAAHEIETFQDMDRLLQAPEAIQKLKAQIQRIPGQKSGISFQYFLMLAGSDFVKPDPYWSAFCCKKTHR